MLERAHGPKSLTDVAFWLLRLAEEAASDLSVYHRIDDWESMSARRWCRLVPLLPAYGGAVAVGLRRIAEEERAATEAAAAPVFRAGPPATGWSRATCGGEA